MLEGRRPKRILGALIRLLAAAGLDFIALIGKKTNKLLSRPRTVFFPAPRLRLAHSVAIIAGNKSRFAPLQTCLAGPNV